MQPQIILKSQQANAVTLIHGFIKQVLYLDRRQPLHCIMWFVWIINKPPFHFKKVIKSNSAGL